MGRQDGEEHQQTDIGPGAAELRPVFRNDQEQEGRRDQEVAKKYLPRKPRPAAIPAAAQAAGAPVSSARRSARTVSAQKGSITTLALNSGLVSLWK